MPTDNYILTKFLTDIDEHLKDSTQMTETERLNFAFRIWLHREWLWDFLVKYLKEV